MKGCCHYISTFKNILRQHGLLHDVFYIYHYRPKRADEIGDYKEERIPKVGIVIQGPLRKEDDFTIETVKLYKKYYPDSPIIVSTWDTESDADLAQIKSICELCVSHFDMKEGNFQRTTSLAGIAKAQEYILKTRTDQRLYATRLLTLMRELIREYPVKIECAVKERIIACGLGTYSDRLYNISDMVLFSGVAEMSRYFSCPIETRQIDQLDKKLDSIPYTTKQEYWTEYCKERPGEIWFVTHYIESLGFELKWTYDDSDFYRNELFLIIDDTTLDLYWPKYSNREYRWRLYNSSDDLHQVSFMDWYLSQLKALRS